MKDAIEYALTRAGIDKTTAGVHGYEIYLSTYRQQAVIFYHTLNGQFERQQKLAKIRRALEPRFEVIMYPICLHVTVDRVHAQWVELCEKRPMLPHLLSLRNEGKLHVDSIKHMEIVNDRAVLTFYDGWVIHL